MFTIHVPPTLRASPPGGGGGGGGGGGCGGGARSAPSVALGVDEAGRGPVLGPMVYACAFWAVELQGAMASRAFDDSKRLDESERARLFREIAEDKDVGHAVCCLSAEMLSEQMLRAEPVSLNKIAHDATVELIERVIREGVDVREIYVDAVGNCDFYQKFLAERFPNATVVVEPKADGKYKCVSAASICAKVTRDTILANWVFPESTVVNPKTKLPPNTDWGCGYPGDEKTKAWLLDNLDPVFGFPNVVRFSWQTTKTLLDGNGDIEAKACRVVFVDEDEALAQQQRERARSISSMLTQAASKRTHYMTSRGVKGGVSMDRFLE